MIAMSDNNYKEFWNEAFNQIRNQYKKENKEKDFIFWFKLEYVSDDGNTITAAVPSEFMLKQMIERGIVQITKDKIKEITGSSVDIKIEINNTNISK